MIFGWLTSIFSRRSTGHTGKPAAPLRKNSSRPGSAKKRSRQRAQNAQASHPYRAVSIYSQTDQCEAAQRLRRTKFLAAHAPALPLGGCTQSEQCRCKYRHYKDRRSDVRRDSDHGMPPRVWLEPERRHRRDRRKNTSSGSAAA